MTSGTSSSTSSSTSGRGRRSTSRPERPSIRRWSPARSFSPISDAGELAHALLVGAADDQRAVPALEELLEDDDLAGDLGAAGEHDVERLVERDLLAALDAVDLDLGVHRDPHLAAGGEDVDGAVVVGAEEGAVRRRRHRELLDLFAERGDVLARLAQGGGEPLVLGDGLGELALGLEDPLLERADPLGGVLEAAPEDDDLFLEGLQLALEVADLPLVLGEAPLVLGSHAVTSWPRSGWPRRRTLHRGTPESPAPCRVPCFA